MLNVNFLSGLRLSVGMGPMPYLFKHIGRLGLDLDLGLVVNPFPVRDGRPKTGIILTLRESRGERLLSLFIFQSSLKVDDEINLNN